MTAIINAKLIIGDDIVEDSILVFDKKIQEIASSPSACVTDVIDAKGAYVSPGFIDMHIHGSGGADVMDATPEALETISSTIIATGTTAFVATTMTMSHHAITAALENIRICRKSVSGAQLIGAHLEGPFLNPQKHGAQDRQYVQLPHMDMIDTYADIIRVITLAPEIEGGMAFVRKCHDTYPDMVLSIGHSEADYTVSMEAFDAGISHVTHLFNAMPSYHHREPGIVGAAFDRKVVTCDIIADLIHTHPHHLRLAWQMKGKNLLLITDAMRAGCMHNGYYDLGGREVCVSEGKAVLSDGTLAGSILKMNDALKQMYHHTEMTLPEVIRSVTVLPAEKLKLNKGHLQAGYDADIVLFDENFSMIAVIVGGEGKYRCENSI